VISRRTLALLQVVANVISIPVLVAVARRQSEIDPWYPPPLPVGAGFVFTVLYHAAYDHDVGGVRRSRLRRGLFVVLANVVQHPFRPQSVDDRYGYALGQWLGTIAYRLRYGVLGAFPDNV
jgi:hypothetical protein